MDPSYRGWRGDTSMASEVSAQMAKSKVRPASHPWRRCRRSGSIPGGLRQSLLRRPHRRTVSVLVDRANAHENVIDGEVLERVAGHFADRDYLLPIVDGRFANDDLVAGEVRVRSHVPGQRGVVRDGASGLHVLRRGGSAGSGDEGDGVDGSDEAHVIAGDELLQVAGLDAVFDAAGLVLGFVGFICLRETHS